ncbi:barstar family protein [Streptomyces sp. NPDC002536]
MTGPLPAPGLPALLNGPTRPGVYRLPPTDSPAHVAVAAAEADWRVARLRLEGVQDKTAFLERCAAELDLPEWFGRNWDALADCLMDLSWWRETGKFRGYLLIAEDWDAFAKAVPGAARTAESVLADAVDFWADREAPLTVLLS